MSAKMVCSQCGAPIAPNERECKYCGEPVPQIPINQAVPPQPQNYQQPYPPQPQQAYPPVPQNYQTPYPPVPQNYQQPYPQQQYPANPGYVMLNDGVNPTWPIKSKTTAGVLAILLGGLGIHKFYLGKAGLGILYLLFCWTYIPSIIGIVEGIIYLTSNDHNFQVKNHVRLQ